MRKYVLVGAVACAAVAGGVVLMKKESKPKVPLFSVARVLIENVKDVGGEDATNVRSIYAQDDEQAHRLWLVSKNGVYAIERTIEQEEEKAGVTSVVSLMAKNPKEEPLFVGMALLPDDAGFVTKNEKDEPKTLKLLASSLNGMIYGWDGKKNDKGQGKLESVINESGRGAIYTGITPSWDAKKLIVTNFGREPGIEVYDENFQRLPDRFEWPFDENGTGMLEGGEAAPMNVVKYKNLKGEQNLLVAFARTVKCDEAAQKAGRCEGDQPIPGMRAMHGTRLGYIVEYRENGEIVTIWRDTGTELNAPWAMVVVPESFGAHAGKLMISNTGNATVAIFDPATRAFDSFMTDDKGEKLEMPGLWGISFSGGGSADGRATLNMGTLGRGPLPQGLYRLRLKE